jgi:hypothetical protein
MFGVKRLRRALRVDSGVTARMNDIAIFNGGFASVNGPIDV